MTWQPAPPVLLQTVVARDGTGTLTHVAEVDERITMVSISAPGTFQGVADVYVNQTFIMRSYSGSADTADGDPPLTVSTGETLTINLSGYYGGNVIIGPSPGATVYVRMEREQDIP